MQWNLRLRAAERGIWKSAQLRRMLADAGLEICCREDVVVVGRYPADDAP